MNDNVRTFPSATPGVLFTQGSLDMLDAATPLTAAETLAALAFHPHMRTLDPRERVAALRAQQTLTRFVQRAHQHGAQPRAMPVAPAEAHVVAEKLRLAGEMVRALKLSGRWREPMTTPLLVEIEAMRAQLDPIAARYAGADLETRDIEESER